MHWLFHKMETAVLLIFYQKVYLAILSDVYCSKNTKEVGLCVYAYMFTATELSPFNCICHWRREFGHPSLLLDTGLSQWFGGYSLLHWVFMLGFICAVSHWWTRALSDYTWFYLFSSPLLSTCIAWTLIYCKHIMCTSLYAVYTWIVWSKTFSLSITSCKDLWVHMCLYVGLYFSLHLEEQPSLIAEGKLETQTWSLL